MLLTVALQLQIISQPLRHCFQIHPQNGETVHNCIISLWRALWRSTICRCEKEVQHTPYYRRESSLLTLLVDNAGDLIADVNLRYKWDLARTTVDWPDVPFKVGHIIIHLLLSLSNNDNTISGMLSPCLTLAECTTRIRKMMLKSFWQM